MDNPNISALFKYLVNEPGKYKRESETVRIGNGENQSGVHPDKVNKLFNNNVSTGSSIGLTGKINNADKMIMGSLLIIYLQNLYGCIIPDNPIFSFAKSMTDIKPITTIMFLFTLLVIIFMFLNQHYDKKIFQFLITLFSSWIMLGVLIILTLLMFSSYLNIKEFEYSLLPGDDPYTLYNSMPASMTLLAFTMISITGGIYIFNTWRSAYRIKFMAIVLSCIGSVAVVGHIINIPSMFYYTKSAGNGMAFNTALYFIITAYLFWRVTKSISNKH